MALVVQKYGGSSVSNAERIRRVAERIVETKKAGHDVVVYCRSGARSARAADFLRARGHRVRNLEGGILAWSSDVDPSIPKY